MSEKSGGFFFVLFLYKLVFCLNCLLQELHLTFSVNEQEDIYGSSKHL